MKKRLTKPGDLNSPYRVLSNLYRDYLENNEDRLLYIASVVSIDHQGGQLEKTPKNPKNSIKARIFTDSYDSFTPEEDLKVFYPFFSHDVMPIKEREHVLVLFLDAQKEHGLWITRVPEILVTDSKNFIAGIDKYKKLNENEEVNDQTVQDLDKNVEKPEISEEFKVEEVPDYNSRVGDRVVKGSNNSYIVLSRDRVNTPDSGEESESGTIDLISGLQDENGNIDFENDKSRVYITMNSNVDENFNIDVGQSTGASAAIAVKSDEIRIVARNGMKLVVEGGEATIEADTINLGKNANQQAVRGNELVDQIKQALDTISTGPIGLLGQVPVPSNAAVLNPAFNAIKLALDQALSDKNNLE